VRNFGRRFLIPLTLLSTLVVVALFLSCREPTAILIEAQTNVVHREGIVTSFTVGKPGTTESAEPTTESRDPWGANGVIGSLVVVPETTNEASVSIKLVMGVGRDPRACTGGGTDTNGCIIARRRLRYTPHEQLRLPIVLYARCENVPCDALTTCNYLGKCVSSEIDPSTCASPRGCHPIDDPPQISSDPDSGQRDAIVDDRSDPAITDAASDGSDSGDSGGDSGRKEREGGTPGTIDCRTAQCTTPLQQCCYNSAAGTGICVSAGSNCPLGSTRLQCDGTEDCAPGTSCCAVSSSFIVCEPTSTCFSSGQILCHSDDRCPLTSPPSACVGQTLNYYSICLH
jgi:hypothetical protein